MVWLSAAIGCWAQVGPTADSRGATAAVASSAHADGADGQDGKMGAQQPQPDAPAQPAAVSLKGGRLRVEANNSDLTQILHDLANKSGMTIKGLDKGPRIFGVYGPGDARQVLTSLLVGSGYDFIMVGDAVSGAPRELLLTPRKSDGLAGNPTSVDSTEHRDFRPAEPDSAAEEDRGRGAVLHAPPPDTRDENTRVQQSLERLQRIHDQQEAAQ